MTLWNSITASVSLCTNHNMELHSKSKDRFNPSQTPLSTRSVSSDQEDILIQRNRLIGLLILVANRGPVSDEGQASHPILA